MSVFKNVSGVDLDLYVDGRPYSVDAGGTMTVADEFDYTLIDQAAWQISPASVAVSPTPAVPTKPVTASIDPTVAIETKTVAAPVDAEQGAN